MNHNMELDRSKQVLDFEGLKRKTKNPKDKTEIGLTDIDFFFDYRHEVFVFGEVKAWGKSLDTGYTTNGDCIKSPAPRMRAEKLVRHCSIPAYFVFAWHNTDPKENILLKDCVVQEIITNQGSSPNKWKHKKINFEEWFDIMLKYHEIT